MSTATDKKKDSAADPPAKAAIEAIEEDDEFAFLFLYESSEIFFGKGMGFPEADDVGL